MPIRIITDDGVGHLTKILDSETGADIGSIVPVNFGARIILDRVVTLECEIDMVAEGAVWRVPIIDGDVAEVRMKDGRIIRIRDDGVPEVVNEQAHEDGV